MGFLIAVFLIFQIFSRIKIFMILFLRLFFKDTRFFIRKLGFDLLKGGRGVQGQVSDFQFFGLNW